MVLAQVQVEDLVQVQEQQQELEQGLGQEALCERETKRTKWFQQTRRPGRPQKGGNASVKVIHI